MNPNKINWVRRLKIGDVVCDCRFKHLPIKKLDPCFVVWFPRILRNIVFADIMPEKLSDWLDDHWCSLMHKLGLLECTDYNITLSDDRQCSAMDCCTPIDNHNSSDHVLN